MDTNSNKNKVEWLISTNQDPEYWKTQKPIYMLYTEDRVIQVYVEGTKFICQDRDVTGYPFVEPIVKTGRCYTKVPIIRRLSDLEIDKSVSEDYPLDK